MSHTIIVDNACDITDDMKMWSNLIVVPFSFEDKRVSTKSNSDNLKNILPVNLPPLIPPSPFLYYDAIKNGGDDIFIITVSDKLSQSFQNARTAADMYNEKHLGDKNIHVFNSFGFGGVQALIAMKINGLIKSGAAFNAIVTLTEYESVNKTECFLCPDNIKQLSMSELVRIPRLDNIIRMGRRQVLSKSRDGKLVKNSYISIGQSIASVLGNKVLALANDCGSQKKNVVISYTSDDATALKIKEMLNNTDRFDAVHIVHTNDLWCSELSGTVSVSIAV